MEYTLTFCEHDYEEVCKLLFEGATTERALYLLAGVSSTPEEYRFLVRSVIPVTADEILDASSHHLSIRARSYLAAIQRAEREDAAFVFVHSHPPGFLNHSRQDDEEESALFRTANNRIHGEVTHGSLVFSSKDKPVGRVWLPSGEVKPISRVRVVGNRFRFFDQTAQILTVPSSLDRQVRAFGAQTQHLLSSMKVGIIGLGGTGSSVYEQLLRLGVRKFVIADPQDFEVTNFNRVYGSRQSDSGTPKVDIALRLARDMQADVEIERVARAITLQSALKRFRSCDVIFGCTDDEWGRSLLTRFAIFYCIPVFDMGVQIDSKDGVIKSVQGRVTTLMPTRACLFCRQRISSDGVAADAMRLLRPSDANRLAKEGYAPELGEPAPAVITFTTTVAATAITELLARLTGFLGDDRRSSEVIHRFSDCRVGTNDRPPSPDCFCGQRRNWGRGDMDPFLDVTWRPE